MDEKEEKREEKTSEKQIDARNALFFYSMGVMTGVLVVGAFLLLRVI